MACRVSSCALGSCEASFVIPLPVFLWQDLDSSISSDPTKSGVGGLIAAWWWPAELRCFRPARASFSATHDTFSSSRVGKVQSPSSVVDLSYTGWIRARPNPNAQYKPNIFRKIRIQRKIQPFLPPLPHATKSSPYPHQSAALPRAAAPTYFVFHWTLYCPGSSTIL